MLSMHQNACFTCRPFAGGQWTALKRSILSKNFTQTCTPNRLKLGHGLRHCVITTAAYSHAEIWFRHFSDHAYFDPIVWWYGQFIVKRLTEMKRIKCTNLFHLPFVRNEKGQKRAGAFSSIVLEFYSLLIYLDFKGLVMSLLAGLMQC